MALNSITDFEQLINIQKKYCIGCGICTTLHDLGLFMDDYGKYNINIDGINSQVSTEVLKICPFSSNTENEDQIGKSLFESDESHKSEQLGYYLKCYIGHVYNDEIRSNSSSGGIITWLLAELLDNNLITHAVHVGKSKSLPILFEYVISTSTKSIYAGSSSRYYPVELSKILDYIKNTEGQYAIVALPCFAKGIRLLQKTDKTFQDRIKFIISPICGHLKTTNYAKFLTLQAGIDPQNLDSINFRKKIPGRLASQYGTEFQIRRGQEVYSKTIINAKYKMGTDWGHGMFKYPACDYCDDIVGEVADISVGDAWLAKYLTDYKGHSVLVLRNHQLNEIFINGLKSNSIKLEVVDPELIVQSQAGGVRNKRDDLKYRLWLKEKRGEWFPLKRVSPSDNIDEKRKNVIHLRMHISEYSHSLFLEALNLNNLNHFYKKMMPLLNRYYLVNFGLIKFIKNKIKNML
ncbi:hypothetical protein SDC9_40153 [bioreactor metagenome]|uniref:Coenzyme F420 hydrogenase/dehydrogenase beta subunit C-terminal domain-containing protein n=1 Tax=bioreactor metagenome TaxID=1076179 RepID=A0A644VRI2_9ZZZZ|nr:Coenzyme F420 hydrogenase/dehydrogenase, beta subunit C-terminal domain [Lentimicrobium sp.]MEA5111754.1 Coenzyme F420 hydrogenase/dehydrogenase, beta subunit C-terminal domain [Lentimicrobium sp.]